MELEVLAAEVRQIGVDVEHPHCRPVAVDQVNRASGADKFGQVVDDPLLVWPVVGQNVAHHCYVKGARRQASGSCASSAKFHIVDAGLVYKPVPGG